MLRSMYSAISGLKNFQTKMDIVGNNISNVSTYGYKKSRITFADLVSQQISGASAPQPTLGGVNAKQVGLGASIGSIDSLQTQGSLQTTGRSLDLAISGDGYFIANKGTDSYYTRAGNLYLDQNGNIVTSGGMKIQGYKPDPTTGNLDTSKLQNLSIDSGTATLPSATKHVTLAGNLDSTNSTSVPMKINAIDSLGNEHTFDLKFTPNTSNPNTWNCSVALPSSGDSTLQSPNITGGPLQFDKSGKLIAPSTPPTLNLTSTATSPAKINDINLNIDVSNITQVSGGNTVAVKNRDGNTKGALQSFSIGSSGEISGVYSNGDVKTLGQIALANFSNPGGLTKQGNNLYKQSNNSGLPNVGIAGNGRGTLTDGALEMSNVDLAEEFTGMIEAQRGFQANARVITTSDHILQTLVDLKR